MALHVMRRISVPCIVALLWCAGLTRLSAQQAQPVASVLTPVPRVVWFSGVFHPADGGPITPVETATVAVYPDREGGAAVWQETQTIAVEKTGHYNILLGSTTSDGLPADLFTSGEPRW